MPRRARVVSQNGMYHVIIRGINRQNIFEDDKDRYHFIEQLKKAVGNGFCEIYGFCLMGNHVHLLIRAEEIHIGDVMRPIGSNYVIWFNLRYDRTGCLFQGRFKSLPIKNAGHFAATLRYIHQNPLIAGVVRSGCRYTFSSYMEYYRDLRGDKRIKGWDFVAKDYTYSILPREEFFSFHDELHVDLENDVMFEMKPTYKKLSDDRANALMAQICGCSNVSEFQTLDEDMRKCYLKDLVDERLPIDQIVRITGISRGVIQRLR